MDAQQTLPSLPPEAAKVEFIWAANDIGTEIETVLVVARDRDRVLWSYEIDGAQEGSGESVIDFPAPFGSNDDKPLVKLKVTPKKDAKD